jgi:hypothetical protein
MAASNSPTLLSSEKTVTTSGTAEALAAARVVYGVTIVAKTGNSNQIYIGGSDVTTSTNDGLDAGDTLEIPGPLDLGDIYLDADTNGEGVDFYATKA